jgi:carboxypeptidase C (cathepsin A)
MRTAQRVFAAALAAALLALPVTIFALDDAAAAKTATEKSTDKSADKSVEKAAEKAPPDVTTQGEVTAGGQHIAYNAIAGTITVGATDPQDAQLGLDGKPQPDSQLSLAAPKEAKDADPTARMFYVAYFKKDAKAEERPITFFYNGGPYGLAGTQARGDGHGYAPAGGALQDGGQRQFLAGCERPGVHRHAGDGIRTAAGQGAGKGILGNR